MSLLRLPRAFHPNSAGSPYALAKWYVYDEGTLDLCSLWSNRQFSDALTNPVVADANGIFPAVHINAGTHPRIRVQLKTSADVLIYDQDEIPVTDNNFPASSFTGAISATGVIASSANLQAPFCYLVDANPNLQFYESDRGTDAKLWEIDVSGSLLTLRTRTDADGAGKDILSVNRTGTAITTISIGNSSDTLQLFLPHILASTSYADDAAAAAGGISVGALYRTGSAIKIRMA